MREDVSLQLQVMQKRLEDIFELLNLWSKYIGIIYMSETETSMIDQIAHMEGRPEELSYVA